MQPHHITNEAVKGIAGNVALTLRKTKSAVYAMGEDPDKDRYTRFVQLFLAVAGQDLARAGMFVTDLVSRFEALRGRRTGAGNYADAHALSRLCAQLIDRIILKGVGRATDEDVHAVALKLHAALGGFLSAGLTSRGGGEAHARADAQEASPAARVPAAARELEDGGQAEVGEEAVKSRFVGVGGGDGHGGAAVLAGVGHGAVGAGGRAAEGGDDCH